MWVKMKSLWHLWVHRFYKLIGVTRYKFTRYGVKAYNKKHVAAPSKENSREIEVNPAEVKLGFDGLNNRYTLAGVPIVKSPHFELEKLLEAGQPTESCDYVKRERTGSLDGRPCLFVSGESRRAAFERSKKQLLDGKYTPPCVFQICSDIYAIDGKHRLAAAALLKKKIRCLCVKPEFILNDSYHKGLCDKMRKRAGDYSKNLELMERLSKAAR